MYLVSDYILSAGKGTCYVCRAHRRSRDEIVLDFGRDIEFEGALQVCAPCIKEAAGLTGAIAEAVALAVAEADELRAERDELGLKLDAAEQAMDAMKIYRSTPRRVKVSSEDAE